MNNTYDRDDPISLSESPRSPSKADWGSCRSCGASHFVRAASGGMWKGKELCPPCLNRFCPEDFGRNF